MIRICSTYSSLLWAFVWRDFTSKYKGSLFGLFWIFLNPLMMLAVYTLVFGFALKTPLIQSSESQSSFVALLFSGLIIQIFFAETMNRCPGLIISNPNYVKKVVFPLEILPAANVISALLNLSVSFFLLALFCLACNVQMRPHILSIPLILAPLFLMVLGLSFIVSALGVYLKDISQIISVITSTSLFISPIFYPVEALPEFFRLFINMNPISMPVMEIRRQLFIGGDFDWPYWMQSFAISLLVYGIGFSFFQWCKKGFSDVI